MRLKSFRFAGRSLRRNPAVLVLVVCTLALGIGSTTAVFAVVDALLIRPPFPNADRIVEIWTERLSGGQMVPRLTDETLRALHAESRGTVRIEAYQFGGRTLTGAGDPVVVSAPAISPGLLPALGVAPVLGRLFNSEDGLGGTHVVLISEALWTSRFGRAADVIGRRLSLDGEPHTIVGVLPARFAFPERLVQVWLPLPLDSSTPTSGRAEVLAVLGGGATPTALNDYLRTVSVGLRARGLLEPDRQLVSADPMQRRWGRQFATALYAMLGAICLVLLVACVNVVNLQLARQADRELDFALQAAMGATAGQLALQVLIESAVLASLGAVGGWMLARVLLQVLLELAPERLTMVSDAANLDWTVMVFAGGVATLVCAAIGAVPAWRAGRADLVSVLKGQSSGGERRTSRWQSTLVVGQLAVALVLLTGAGLLLSSFVKLASVDPGFAPDHLLAFKIQLPEARYQAPGSSLNLVQQLKTLVEGIGGVSHATFCDNAPPMAGSIIIDGQPEVDGTPRDGASGLEWPASTVAPDYFSTMGIPLVDGHPFDRADPRDVVIVNDVIARRFWGHTSPIGHRFRLDPSQPWWTVVGVAKDVKAVGPDDRMGEGMELYYPYGPESRSHFFTLIVRGAGDESAVIQQVKARLWSLDAGAPVIEATSMNARLVESVAEPRFYLRLCITFAAMAVLLAGVGVYGTAVYWVTRRRRVFGIQMALGATRQHVVGIVLRRSAWLAAVGSTVGVAMSLAASTVLRSLLFETDARDPGILVAVTALLAALVVVATLVPALRASVVDPATVLRQD